MIKALFKLSLCFILGSTLLFSQAKEAEFLPEVKALFEIQPLDPTQLEKNLFIVFHGLTFPRDNYDTIFAKALRNNYEKIALSINRGNFS